VALGDPLFEDFHAGSHRHGDSTAVGATLDFNRHFTACSDEFGGYYGANDIQDATGGGSSRGGRHHDGCRSERRVEGDGRRCQVRVRD